METVSFPDHAPFGGFAGYFQLTRIPQAVEQFSYLGVGNHTRVWSTLKGEPIFREGLNLTAHTGLFLQYHYIPS
jgi:hypothetical protein